jgi:hypothetical protein
VVDVVVVTKDTLDSEPEEVWAVQLDRPPAEPEEFENDVQDIAYDRELKALLPHVLTARRTHVSWGAHAVAWQSILEIAAHYADEALAGLITAKFVTWWEKSRSADAIYPGTKEAAKEKAEWAILLAYEKLSRGDLQDQPCSGSRRHGSPRRGLHICRPQSRRRTEAIIRRAAQ